MGRGYRRTRRKRFKSCTKARAQFKHTIKRMHERFDIIIGRQTYGVFIRDIQEGRAEFIAKRSNRVSLFRIKYQDNYLVVVYDRLRKTIVTVLHDKEHQEVENAGRATA